MITKIKQIIVIILFVMFLLKLSIRFYVDNIIYNLHKTSKQIDKKTFLINVCKNVEFYKKINPSNIKNFPIVTKSQISNNDNFLNHNVKLIKKSKMSANSGWVDKKEVSIDDINYFTFFEYIYYLHNGYAISNISGGSSGNYFYQWYTLNECRKGLYGFIKCWSNMGWKPGYKILIIYFHGSNSIKLTKKLSFFYEGIKSYSPILNEHNDLTLESFFEIINLINEYKPYLIVGFPNIMFRLCELIYKNKTILLYVPKCMDLSADFLFTCQYDFIKSIFVNCDIRLSYGTIEFGQIAQQIPGKMYDYKIFDDIVDVENSEDNKLIVTNYLFETQPMIRYLTDDIGVMTNGGIIKDLIGKNKYNSDDRFNFIIINDHINKINNFNVIINFRINIITKNIYIKVINNDYNSLINEYFNKVYNKDFEPIFKININTCDNTSCNTIDKYSGKRSPILNN